MTHRRVGQFVLPRTLDTICNAHTSCVPQLVPPSPSGDVLHDGHEEGAEALQVLPHLTLTLTEVLATFQRLGLA